MNVALTLSFKLIKFFLTFIVLSYSLWTTIQERVYHIVIQSVDELKQQLI